MIDKRWDAYLLQYGKTHLFLRFPKRRRCLLFHIKRSEEIRTFFLTGGLPPRANLRLSYRSRLRRVSPVRIARSSWENGSAPLTRFLPRRQKDPLLAKIVRSCASYERMGYLIVVRTVPRSRCASNTRCFYGNRDSRIY